uniref:B30.2/SPRY domain-containing protein n=1 Tax=Globodera pallida TaxID=36090 RepID=A0A183CCJ2_GLOPA
MFFSTNSTHEGHITARSEEVPLLRAKIAELERQQTMNYGIELENKTLRAELAHQKQLNAHMALQTKMEVYLNKQHQKTIDELTEKLKVSIDQFSLKQQEHVEKADQKALSATVDQGELIAKMEYQKQLQQNIDAKMTEYQKQLQQNIDAKMTEYQKQLQQNIDAKMTEYQKQLQQNIVDLQKTVAVLNDTINGKGLIPQQTRWDSAACHKDLTLSEPDRLIAQRNGEANCEWRAVFAERAVPKDGIVYFEVKVLEQKSYVSIGLGAKQMPVVDYKGTYSYNNMGYFCGHEVRGCCHAANGRPYMKSSVWRRRRRRLRRQFGNSPNYLHKKRTAFGLYHPGDKIEANFGPNFKVNIADGI